MNKVKNHEGKTVKYHKNFSKALDNEKAQCYNCFSSQETRVLTSCDEQKPGTDAEGASTLILFRYTQLQGLPHGRRRYII